MNFSVRIPREVVMADKLMLQGVEDPKPEPSGTGIKQVEAKENLTDFGLGIIKAIYNPVEGEDFAYPDGSQDPGELPTNDIGAITLLDEDGNTLASMFGFSVTFDKLATLTTQAKFNAFFFSGSDQIDGGDESNLLHGFGGNDTVYGGGGKDILYGDAGEDALNGDAGDDTLQGASGADVIFGGDGKDRLVGGTGNDRLNGDSNADILLGGVGNDMINGGLGPDMLSGGAGKDVFVYRALPKALESGPTAATRDTITDFHHRTDKIDISFISVDKFDFVGKSEFSAANQVHYEVLGKNTLVEISTDSDRAAEISILLHGHIGLTGGDFVL